MSDAHCPYCGSVGTCHDPCVGVEIEPLKKRVAELEKDTTLLQQVVSQMENHSRHLKAERDEARKLCRASWFAFLHGDSDDLDALEKAVKQWGKIK
jgi:hypothetical protein